MEKKFKEQLNDFAEWLDMTGTVKFSKTFKRERWVDFYLDTKTNLMSDEQNKKLTDFIKSLTPKPR